MEKLKITREDISPINKKLTVEVPAGAVKIAVDAEFVEFGKTAKISGFRPGKIPREVLRQKYGGRILGDVAGKVIEKTFQNVLKEEKLIPVDRPRFEVSQIGEASSLVYTATVDVRPEITLTGYTSLNLERRSTEVTDDEIENGLMRLLDGKAEYKEIKRKAEKGDMAMLNFEGTSGGEPIENGKAENYPVIVGDTVLPGFDEVLEGASADDEFSLDTAFPDEYHNKKLAGKAAHFDIKVLGIRERVAPALDNALARSYGVKNLGELKAKIVEETLAGKEYAEDERLKGVAVEQLIEQNPFDIPDSMQERYYQGVLKTAQKMKEESENSKFIEITDEIKDKYREIAVLHAKRDIILDVISDQESIKVNEQEVDEAAKVLGAPKGEEPDRVIARLIREGTFQMFLNGLRDRKVFDMLLGKVGPETVAEGTGEKPNEEAGE